MIQHVTSQDGTSIGYERFGDGGPAVVLVGGGLADKGENAPLGPELAERFTVYNYDRRGRGTSEDRLPYAVEREIEDLRAVIDVAGGTAHLYGASSGGALAFEAAAAGLPIGKIAVWEVPYLMAEDMRQWWGQYVEDLNAALAKGERGEAVELFMRMAGSSEDDIKGAREHPIWPELEVLAPTLAYDAACLGDGSPPADRLARLTQETLVVTGGGGGDFFAPAAVAIAELVPRARQELLEGQGHMVDPKALAPVLARFFAD